MVDDEILLPDRREHVAAALADPLGEARIVGLELQVRAVDPDDLGQLVQREHALHQEDRVRGDLQLVRHEAAQILRHPGLDLEADHDAAAALLQGGLEVEDEILGLLLDLEVGIAHDAGTRRCP